MNDVFLSGIAEAAPLMVSPMNAVAHAVMNLTVVHRTAKGLEKREQYPVSAWHGVAQRMCDLVKAGSYVTIKGYLSQKKTEDGVFMEVTVKEFQTSSGAIANKPALKNVPIKMSSNGSERKSGEPKTQLNSATIIADQQEA